MIRSRTTTALTVTFLALSTYSLTADVRTEQKTRVELAGVLGKIVNMFGGKGAREGVTSKVAVKGDRKASLNDTTGQIIDLAEEKVYDLDIKRKSYKVSTFAELRRQMEEAQKKAQENARKEQPREQAAPDPNQKEVEIDFDIKNTGQRKTVNGFDTHQAVMTVTVREKGKTLEESGGLLMTTDIWLAPRIAAMKEVADFDMRYAQKLYGPMVSGVSADEMAAALAAYPMMKPALARMSAEGAKLEGTPILTTTTMDSVKSAEQMAAEAKQTQDEKPSTASSPGGMLGGMLARRMAQRQKADDGAPKSRVTFMTSTTEMLKLTTDVSAADVAVPAGFQQK